MPTPDEIAATLVRHVNAEIDEQNQAGDEKRPHIEEGIDIGQAIAALNDELAYDVPSMLIAVLTACNVPLTKKTISSIMFNVPSHWST